MNTAFINEVLDRAGSVSLSRLLGCPFCGQDEAQVENVLDRECESGSYEVRCAYCGARGEITATREQAIEMWNTRAT